MRFVASQEAKLKAVSLSEINAVIRKYIDPSRITNVFAGDFAGAQKTLASGAVQK